MARIYYRSSLFLYTVEQDDDDESPILRFWRATVYTFWKPVKKETLREIIEDAAQDTAIEEWGKTAYEAEQVEPSESRGLGFYWVDVSMSESRGKTLVYPERRVAVYHLPTWEKTHTRLGYEYLGLVRRVLKSISDMLGGSAS